MNNKRRPIYSDIRTIYYNRTIYREYHTSEWEEKNIVYFEEYYVFWKAFLKSIFALKI